MEVDKDLQEFLVTMINGWVASGHPPERLARVVELAVRQQVEKENKGEPPKKRPTMPQIPNYKK